MEYYSRSIQYNGGKMLIFKAARQYFTGLNARMRARFALSITKYVKMYKVSEDHSEKLPQKCNVCGTKTELFYVLHRLDILTPKKRFILAKDLFDQFLCVQCFTDKVKETITEAQDCQKADSRE